MLKKGEMSEVSVFTYTVEWACAFSKGQIFKV